MHLSEFEHFRDILLKRQQYLSEWLHAPGLARLGDAAKIRALLSEIKEALSRIEDNTYGQCRICHGEVERDRLEVQPLAQVCLDCITDKEKAELEEDLYLAGEIHRALLPQTAPVIDGFEIHTRSLAAGSVGGDYYDFLARTGDHTDRIVIGDVMGKGLRAGMLMSNLQSAMRILSTQINSPGPLLARLNTWMCRNIPVTKFISMVLLELSPADHGDTLVTYANAGHPPPVIVRQGGKVERFEVTGGILGVHDKFTYGERRETLSSGDLLMLFTDGIVEAENASGDRFEDRRLIEFLCDHRTDGPPAIIDGLLTCLQDFTGGANEPDDMTAMVLRKL